MDASRPAPIDPELLLAHDLFVRRLAGALLRRREGAEDVAQQTWVAALTRGPGDPGTLRGWLATVVRRLVAKDRVKDARRLARETAVASDVTAGDGATLSEQAYLAREQLRRRVVDALFTLEEPYRTTMVLRYLDDLPPRAVAVRMGVPVETVRTRVKRALAQLRERLRAELGPDEEWRGALAALAMGAAAMSGPAKFAGAAAAIALAAAWLGWEAWSDAKPHETLAASREAAPAAIVDPPADAMPTRTPVIAAEIESPPSMAPAPSTVDEDDLDGPAGSLVVTTVDGVGRPLADVWLIVVTRRSGAPFGEELEGLTDAQGERRFDGVVAGPVQVKTGLGASGRATVVAGGTGHLRIRIDRAEEWAVDVEGVVVDERDAPVADATIWLNRYDHPLRARLVATSDEQGLFALERVPQHQCSGVWAAAEGFAASMLAPLSALPRSDGVVRVRLVVRRGAGALAGLVIGVDGVPLAGASIVVGADRSFFVPEALGTEGQAIRVARVATSDEGGRFDLAGIAPGTWPIVVRRRGFATKVDNVVVRADERADVTIVLERGAILEGRVVDVDGTPCAGAEVQTGSPWFFRSSRATTRSDGSFVLGGLPAGRVAVRAIDFTRGRVATTLDFLAGECTRWEARLPAGEAILGRVNDADGEPVAGLDVTLRGRCDSAIDPIDPNLFLTTTTMADGRFAFERLPGGLYELEFTRDARTFPELARHDLEPGGAPLELVVEGPTIANAYVVGEVEDADGTPVRKATFFLDAKRGGFARVWNLDPSSGRLRAGPLVAGDYSILVSVEGHPEFRLADVTIEADAEHDLGVVVLPRLCTLTVRCTEAGRETRAGIKTRLACPDGYMREAFVKDGVARFEGVVAGHHDLQVGGEGVTLQCLPVEILDGRDATIDVVVQPGIARIVRFAYPPRPRDPLMLPTATLRTEGSTVELASTLLPDLGGAPFDWHVTLAPGRYRVVGSLERGQLPEELLIVTPDDPPGSIFEFRFP